MENYLGVDQRFNVFHELMARKVRDILLVSSPYDAFIMEEDGSIAARIINEFHGLNLSNPPRLQWASSAPQALAFLARRRYDLVITMPQDNDMDGRRLAKEVKRLYDDVPVVLLAHSLASARLGPEPLVCGRDIDHFFIWSTNPALFLAIIKNVEDHLNVAVDTAKAMVRVLILVEDSPLYASFFLPAIYKQVVQQTQAVLDESLNQEHRLLKMRARPKILLATTYEEAVGLYERYQEYVFAVISDVRFPRQCRLDPRAGIRLLAAIRRHRPDLPLLLLSSEAANSQEAEEIGVGFIHKTSPRLEEEIHDFFLNHLGFGDFVFRYPDGRMTAWASNFRGFEYCLATVADESLVYHAENNHFSNWIMARSEVALAVELRKLKVADFPSAAALRAFLVEAVHALRRQRQRGVVVQFSATEFDPEVMDFVKIGGGSLGGKARGLAFLAAILPRCPELQGLGLRVAFPGTTVIGSEGFLDFVRENQLHHPGPAASDDEIGRLFLGSPLPVQLSRDLRALLTQLTGPLIIRSSSVLEDGHARPYAGLYKTYILANNHPDFRVRFRMFQDAIKLVWASAWYAGPQAFSRALRASGQEDAMAVLIQALVGRQYGHYFYPAMAGVALSHNYYPVAKMQADEGVVHLALGLGKTVVAGEKSLRFSPKYPQVMPHFSTVEDILRNCQRFFYALDLNRNDTLLAADDSACLARREVDTAAADEAVQMLTSVYIPAEERIRDGNHPGMKVLTFARILKQKHLALAPALTEIMRLVRQGLGCPAEIEFAVDLDADPAHSTLYVVQMRPMVTGGGQGTVEFSEAERRQAFCHSLASLGHGILDTIADVVLVRPERFDPAKTREVARDIHRLNQELERAKRPYLLVGPGRWGSADPWLGIPVQWQDISGVGALVELRSPAFMAEPSQGSHFFQNITSLGIPYVTISPGQGRFDLEWLESQELVAQTPYVQHLRVAPALVIKINGVDSECLMWVGGPAGPEAQLTMAD